MTGGGPWSAGNLPSTEWRTGRSRCSECRSWHENDYNLTCVIVRGRLFKFCSDDCEGKGMDRLVVRL